MNHSSISSIQNTNSTTFRALRYPKFENLTFSCLPEARFIWVCLSTELKTYDILLLIIACL